MNPKNNNNISTSFNHNFNCTKSHKIEDDNPRQYEKV